MLGLERKSFLLELGIAGEAVRQAPQTAAGETKAMARDEMVDVRPSVPGGNRPNGDRRSNQ